MARPGARSPPPCEGAPVGLSSEWDWLRLWHAGSHERMIGMARIVISTVGSAGDLNPFLALGLGLRERGHDVLFAVEERMSHAIRVAGFPVHPLAGDGQEIFEKYSPEFINKLTPIPSLRVVIERYLLPA